MRTFLIDTSLSPKATLRPVAIESVKLMDNFWAPRIERLREVTLPSQHELLESTGRVFNFRRAAGTEGGEFVGFFFNDSDVYKWVEAVALSLAYGPDERLRGLVDNIIEDIISAQDRDGYLDTYFTFERKGERWTNLREMHELYCAGHLIQAAVAMHRATGDRRLLDAARRFADQIITIFGPGGREGVCGHPEIEMAMVELYRELRDRRYLEMAQRFIDNRGKGLVGGLQPLIDHKPFMELTEIVGHAVRSLYLNCGAADVYIETGDTDLWDALERLWLNMTQRRMYVTGGAGARYDWETFGVDYELPNARAYAETCAAIANVMWNWRMLLASGDARFADVMELALYNGVLSGISLDGEGYFYVNPLADRGGHRRQRWFDCACCPPNVARVIAGVPGYIYCTSEQDIWVNLYARSSSELRVQGNTVRLTQQTDYPWGGAIELIVEPHVDLAFGLRLRIPGWCERATLTVNDRDAGVVMVPGTYSRIFRHWSHGDRVRLELFMSAEQVSCNANVDGNLGRIAMRRGPLIYCVEQVDNEGFDVWDLVIPVLSELRADWEPALLNGIMTIRGEALVVDSNLVSDALYLKTDPSQLARRVVFTAIPYFAWANRQPGPMIVWMRSQVHENIRR